MITAGQKLMFAKEIVHVDCLRAEEDLQMKMGPEADQVEWDQEGVQDQKAE